MDAHRATDGSHWTACEEKRGAISEMTILHPVSAEINTEEGSQTLMIEPEALYGQVRQYITAFMGGGSSGTSEQQRVSSMVKVAVKGVLLMYGNQILDVMFGTSNHPKPGKKDDLIEWYTDMFTKIAIAAATKTTLILDGVRYETGTIKVTRIRARPNTEACAALTESSAESRPA